jgi:uncharacterized repeat protein (TIGR01451 family)
MATRSTSVLRIIVICAAVFALLVAAAGIAVADDPPTTDETTEVTEPTTETTVDTTPDTTPTTTEDTTPTTTEDTTPTTTEDTTPTTAPEPEETTFGALDVGAQAATANRVTVHKVVQSGDPAQDFPITLRRCTNTSCSGVSNAAPIVNETHDIPGGGSVDFTSPLVNGSRYRLVEQLPSGWRFLSATCTGTPSGSGSALSAFVGSGVRFVHATDTAWDCYFTNANNRVTITKTSDGPDPATITLQECSSWFFICLDWDPVNSSGYSDGSSQTFTSLTSNADLYRIIESVPDGYRLTGVTCSGGSFSNHLEFEVFGPVDGVSFSLSNGNPTRSCTFTNTENRITVTKATSPVGAPRDFTVNIEKCDVNIFANCLGNDWNDIAGSPATLSDGESISITGTDVDASFFDRFFRVQEDDPGEWDVAVDCVGQFGIGSPVSIPRGEAFTFSLLKNIPAVADCTVTNSTETGSITVAKVSDPAGGEGFEFSFDDLDDPSDPAPIAFTVDDDGSQTFSDLFPSGANGYEILETALPEGWSLDGVVCPDADTVETPDGVAVLLARGQNVTCTFTNTNPTEPAISLTKTPDPESAVVGDTIAYTYVVTNDGPVEVTDLTLVDTPLGDVTLDSTTLAPTGQPGDTATGTLTRDVTDADAGTTITNTALATGFVSCNPEVEVCAAERGATEVTAEADASVDVAAVGGEVVTNDPVGVGSATTNGQLPFTGSSTLGPILGALGLLGAGGLLVLLDQKRRQGFGV